MIDSALFAHHCTTALPQFLFTRIDRGPLCERKIAAKLHLSTVTPTQNLASARLGNGIIIKGDGAIQREKSPHIRRGGADPNGSVRD